MSMTKRDLIKSVYNQLDDLTLTQVEEVVNTVLETVVLFLRCGEDVKLTGFGKFERSVQKEVVRRDPRNGEPVKVPEKITVRFYPSGVVKSQLNRVDNEEVS